MIKIISGRCTGKTIKLIQLCYENGGYIVCRHDMVDIIATKAKEIGLHISYPLSYFEFVNKRYYEKGVKKIYIDDAESLLQYMSKAKIVAITITNDK